jgi:hypothetical protein
MGDFPSVWTAVMSVESEILFSSSCGKSVGWGGHFDCDGEVGTSVGLYMGWLISMRSVAVEFAIQLPHRRTKWIMLTQNGGYSDSLSCRIWWIWTLIFNQIGVLYSLGRFSLSVPGPTVLKQGMGLVDEFFVGNFSSEFAGGTSPLASRSLDFENFSRDFVSIYN